MAARSSRSKCKVLHVRGSRNNDEKMPDAKYYGMFSSDVSSVTGINKSFDEHTTSEDITEINNHSSDDAEDYNRSPYLLGSSFTEGTGSESFIGLPKDLLRFAQWTFNVDGLSELRILAPSNFSYQGRYARHIILLCRNGSSALEIEISSSKAELSNQPFRYLISKDRALLDLLQRNFQAIDACAVDTIMKFEDCLQE